MTSQDFTHQQISPKSDEEQKGINLKNIEKDNKSSEIKYVHYTDESQLFSIMKLMENDLSEPYSIYTYRYFVNNWPKLCWLVHRFFFSSVIVFN
jgi:hypothetical protein